MITDVLLPLVIGIRAQAQRPIVDKARTSKRPRRHAGLFGHRVEPVAVGTLLSHAYNYSHNDCKQAMGGSPIGTVGCASRRAALPPHSPRQGSSPASSAENRIARTKWSQAATEGGHRTPTTTWRLDFPGGCAKIVTAHPPDSLPRRIVVSSAPACLRELAASLQGPPRLAV